MQNSKTQESIFRKIKATRNRVLTNFSYNFRTAKSPVSPNIDNLEVTNVCNLKCIMCPITKMTREKKYMDFSLFSKIIDENSHLGTVWLHNFGEPLLHPELPRMISYCKSKHLKVGISTNATLLTEAIANNIIDAGLDYVVFSFDGATKETYEKIRVGANFESVRNNITSFIRIKQQKLAKNPFITVQIIRMKETDADIRTFYDFWKTAGVDTVRIKGFDTFAGSVGTSGTKDEYLYNCSQQQRYPCKWLWKEVVVLVDGSVVMCCRDFDGEIILGNLREQKLKDIWNSKQTLELRKKHKKLSFEDIPVCSKCREWYGARTNPIWPLPYPSSTTFRNLGRRKTKKVNLVSDKSLPEDFQGDIPVMMGNSEKVAEKKKDA